MPKPIGVLDQEVILGFEAHAVSGDTHIAREP